MERDYTLYQHFCKVTKKSYIGITKQEPKKRWKAYGKGYRPNTHFGNAIRKYGWDNFEHIILATNLTEEEAKQLEQTCIVVFETYGKYGYNSTFGGDGTLGFTKVISQEQRKKISKANKGHIVTQETREKISKNNKGRVISEQARKQISNTLKQKYKDGYIAPSTGKHPSEETRQKMSEAKKGRHLSEEHKQKLSEAGKGRKVTKETRNKLSEVLKGKGAKKVGQYTKDGELVNIYMSMTDAEQYGFSLSNISKCCRGVSKTHKGYIWKYM